MELALPMKSYGDLLDEQKKLFENQIEKLQDVVATQCKLTGVNPLSQEMAAGALSIKIGKRPRDLLNPKAVKYMQSVFSIKDAISKRETREMSAQFGVTVTQVRDFFTGQRTRVRKFARISREKATSSSACDGMRGEVALTDPNMPAEPLPLNTIEPLPLNTIAPTNIDEEPSCSKKQDDFSGMGESDLQFVSNIFGLMRKEESFSGQVKLLKWILRMENPSVLSWFLAEGGLMILATWLSEAAKEEQSSFIRVVLKLFHSLPMIKALPVHMSAVLQSVNRLRFYRTSDISHRARVLLAKWSNIFGKKLSLKKNNGSISASELEDEMLLKQSIDEVMGDESWNLKDDNAKEAFRFLGDSADNHRMFEVAQPLKMLTAPGDESNKRKGVLPSHTKERRKVQMVEHPSQRLAIRSAQVARPTSLTQSRPLSADDIQKAKMRAQFMLNKHGKTVTSTSPDEKVTSESQNRCTSSHASSLSFFPKSHMQTELGEERKLDNAASKDDLETVSRSHIQTKLGEERKLDSAASKDDLATVSRSHIQTELGEERKLDNAVSKLDVASNSKSHIQTELVEERILDNAVSKLDLSSVYMSHVQTELEEERKLENAVSKPDKPREASPEMKEPLWKTFERIQIPWRRPPEVEIVEEWCVGDGANSKEIEVQKNRIRREREIVYRSTQEIPPNPKEPWDREMDPDDTLTPEIPIEQLPDVEPLETPSFSHNGSNENVAPVASSSESLPQPDLELLAELLKNPQLVFALTSGQAGNLSVDATVKLLDMIKSNGVSSLGKLAGDAESRVEVSLPSPTPSAETVPNGTRPDFSRNPFSRQPMSANGNMYPATVGVPATTILAPQPSMVVQQPVASPAAYLQSSVQLPEQWHAPSNTQMYHFNTSHAQHLTTMMPNAQTIPNSDRAGSSVVGGYNVNSSRARQVIESNYHHQNNQNLNGYNAYAGGPVPAAVPPHLSRGGRPEYDSWSPEDSPSRHHDYLPGPYHGETNRNSRHAYRDERAAQQQNLGGPRNKRWRDDGR